MAHRRVLVGSHDGVVGGGTGHPGSAGDPEILKQRNSCSVAIAQIEVEGS